MGALFSSLMAVSDFSRVGTRGFLPKFSPFSPDFPVVVKVVL